MSRKRPTEHRDVLNSKLQCVNEYLGHVERKLEQFKIDLAKTRLHDLGDLVGFLNRVQNALSDLYSADPSKSLIEADLAESRLEFNEAYRTDPEVLEIRNGAKVSGFAVAPTESGFDSDLSCTMTSVLDRLNRIQTQVGSPGVAHQTVREIIKLMEVCRCTFDAALQPARLLRGRILNKLNGRSGLGGSSTTKAKPPGRPRNPAIAERNRRIYESWLTKEPGTDRWHYKDFKDLAKVFDLPVDTVKKAVIGERNKLGRPDARSRKKR
jgi:hypothetical protein